MRCVQEEVFFKLGQLAATVLVQGGSGHHLFSEPMFNYIRGMNICDIAVDITEVPNSAVRGIAQRVSRL